MGSTEWDDPGRDCAHLWISNSGRGGPPEFRRVSMFGEAPVMHVMCERCKCRTWFTEAQWHALPRPGETRQQQRRRQREAAVLARREQERQAREFARRMAEYERTGRTYWNGEPAECRRVVVRVAPSPVATWWCAPLAGQERRAVEVRYHGQTFYLDDEDGSGWAKVTIGMGSPGYGHNSLPDGCEVLREVAP